MDLGRRAAGPDRARAGRVPHFSAAGRARGGGQRSGRHPAAHQHHLRRHLGVHLRALWVHQGEDGGDVGGGGNVSFAFFFIPWDEESSRVFV